MELMMASVKVNRGTDRGGTLFTTAGGGFAVVCPALRVAVTVYLRSQ